MQKPRGSKNYGEPDGHQTINGSDRETKNDLVEKSATFSPYIFGK